VQLDLFNTLFVVGCLVLFEFSGTGLDFVVGFIDIVSK